MSDDRYVQCAADCGKDVDLTERHLLIERRFEQHDPPGSIVGIDHAVGAQYHVECAPSIPAVMPGPMHSSLVQQSAQEFARSTDFFDLSCEEWRVEGAWTAGYWAAVAGRDLQAVRRRVEEAIGTFTFRGDKQRDWQNLVETVMAAVATPGSDGGRS